MANIGSVLQGYYACDGLIKIGNSTHRGLWAAEYAVRDGILFCGGTERTAFDWVNNFDLSTKPVRGKFGDEIRVHAGMLREAERAYAYAERRDIRAVVGYSQGGGIATILSHMWGVPAWTFNAPRAVARGSELHYAGDCRAFSNAYDRVSDLPLRANWVHVGIHWYVRPEWVSADVTHAYRWFMRLPYSRLHEHSLPYLHTMLGAHLKRCGVKVDDDFLQGLDTFLE